jgi:hypothetical protein
MALTIGLIRRSSRVKGTWKHFPWRGALWNGRTLRWECGHHHRDKESAYRCARKAIHDAGYCRSHTINKGA